MLDIQTGRASVTVVWHRIALGHQGERDIIPRWCRFSLSHIVLSGNLSIQFFHSFATFFAWQFTVTQNNVAMIDAFWVFRKYFHSRCSYMRLIIIFKIIFISDFQQYKLHEISWKIDWIMASRMWCNIVTILVLSEFVKIINLLITNLTVLLSTQKSSQKHTFILSTNTESLMAIG